jgi:hypothetical protein
MGRIGTHWITDRWPTQADATPGGYVEVLCATEGTVIYKQWNRITRIGHPWRRILPDSIVIGKHPENPTPRRFVSINRTCRDLGQTVDAIADDGTAWRLLLSQGQWIQLPPLPAREG